MLPKARVEGLVLRTVGQDLVIYDKAADKSHTLNETAALIFRACDGTRGVAELAALLPEGGEASERESLVWSAIAQLNRGDLLVEKVAVPGEMNRRESFAKLAAAVALPVVLSMLAPKKAQAVSGDQADGAQGNDGGLIITDDSTFDDPIVIDPDPIDP